MARSKLYYLQTFAGDCTQQLLSSLIFLSPLGGKDWARIFWRANIQIRS